MQQLWVTSLRKVIFQINAKLSAKPSSANITLVGDYSIFIQDWTEPNGGIHGYLTRFLASGDPTFQHIAIWTLLQLLESEDKKLISLISKTEDVIQMIKTISDKNIESDDEDGEDGEGEVVALARRSLELLGKGPKSTLVEG